MAMAKEITKAKEERLAQNEQRRRDEEAAKKLLKLMLNGMGLCGDAKVLPAIALSYVILELWSPAAGYASTDQFPKVSCLLENTRFWTIVTATSWGDDSQGLRPDGWHTSIPRRETERSGCQAHSCSRSITMVAKPEMPTISQSR